MSVLSDLKSVKSINANSTSGIISISNDNFLKISRSLYTFLVDLKYNEDDKYMKFNEVESNVFTVNTRIRMILNGMDMFRVDNNGHLFAKRIYSESIIQSKVNHLMMYDGFPKHGNPGDIVYGRNKDNIDIDFYGYVENIGWVSLTQGSSGSGGGTGTDITMPFSVDGIIDESVLPQSGGTYIIESGEHAGKVAMYDATSGQYEFLEFPSGSYTVNNEDGKVYICRDGDIGYMTWEVLENPCRIGYSESGDEEYKDGQYTDFNPNTRVGVAIDRFNKDIKKLYDASPVAFKNIEGVAHTSVDKGYYEEKYAGGVIVPGKNIFVDDISNLDQAIEAGMVEETTSNLSRIDGSDAYKIIDSKGKRVTTAISGAFGSDYTIDVYDNNSMLVPKSDYIVQHASGIVLYIGTEGKRLSSIKYYDYKGDTVQSFSANNKVRLDPTDSTRRVTANLKNLNNQKTGIYISNDPKLNSKVIVSVNGVAVSVYGVAGSPRDYDCYFVNKHGETKQFANISKGDTLIWNSLTAGYPLDTTDIVSLDYLSVDDSGFNPGGGGGSSAATSVDLVAGETITPGSFVRIDSNGMVYLATADDENGGADGFCSEGASENDECTVILSGVVEIGGVSNLSIGDYVYLSTDGGYTSTVDNEITILQNVATILEPEKMFIHINEPIIM